MFTRMLRNLLGCYQNAHDTDRTLAVATLLSAVDSERCVCVCVCVCVHVHVHEQVCVYVREQACLPSVGH